MTLHGDRVTLHDDLRKRYARMSDEAWWRAAYRGRSIDIEAYSYDRICPACRARYTDDQLRAMLAQPKETT